MADVDWTQVGEAMHCEVSDHAAVELVSMMRAKGWRVVEADPLPAPSGGVGVKLASLARHAEEHCSHPGHPLDWAAVKALVNDPEVLEYMQRLEAAALLPVAR